jgi:hypothetical protein
MNIKNKYYWKTPLPLFALLILYFTSRLYHLANFPMFADEGLHIWRAIVVTREGLFAEILRLGKFLTIWIMSIFVPFSSDHLLWMGRFISVVFGALGLVGCYLLGKRLFNHRVGLMVALLYLVVPYTFFYDRMAHVDGPLTVLAVYVTYFSLRFAQRPTLISSVILGFTLMLLVITKLNGFVLGMIPLLVLITAHHFQNLRSFPWSRFVLVYGIASLGFIPLFLNFNTHWDRAWDRMQVSRPASNTLPFWLTWLSNIEDIFYFLGQNLSWIVFCLVCLGAVMALIHRHKNDWLLWGSAALTLVVFVVVPKADGWYPRYLLPAVPFLLLIAAQTIDWGLNKLQQYLSDTSTQMWSYGLGVLLMVIIILPALWFDYRHLANPPQTPFVEIDRWQYISGAYAGYALDQSADFIRQQLPPAGQIVVVYDNHPGSIYDVLQSYLYGEHNRIIHVILNFAAEDPDQMAQKLQAESKPVFLILSDPPTDERTINPDTWPYIERVARFERPGGQTAINIYRNK